MVRTGRGECAANSCSSFGVVVSSVSVMRSCSSGAMRWRSASVRTERTASSNTRPRSILSTGSEQIFAMSVAFDAHGEIVPSRGTT